MATVWIPADRFLDLLDRCNVANEELSNAEIKRLHELRTGRQEALSLDTADRILTGLGLSDMFHVSKEDGGLDDIYTGEAVFTPSWVAKSKVRLEVARDCRREVAPARHALNGRRKTKSCKCGTPITDRSTTCIPCYRESVRNQATKEETLAAARRYYHAWSRRKGRRCECGTPILDSSTTCKPCYLAGKPRPEHGTRSRYVSGCRCAACTRAEADYACAYKRRLRASYLEAQAAA